MISQFKKLFDRSIVPNNRITITEHDKFREVKKHNREVLNTFDEWLSEYDWKNSYYGYGVPSYIYPLLNSYIGLETTYTDLIAYYSRAFKKVKYLELGVSVGKNFMQLANNFECALLTGFDIENINPVIHNSLKHQSTINWPTASDSLRKAPSYLSKYKLNTNSISYLAGDIWDENSWKNFEGTKFNVIFSDALHDPQALLWEFEMIKKYNLLEDEFLFFWDDLNNGLENSFLQIAKELLNNKIIVNSNIHLIKTNGWVGINEPIKHDVGIISTFSLK